MQDAFYVRLPATAVYLRFPSILMGRGGIRVLGRPREAAKGSFSRGQLDRWAQVQGGTSSMQRQVLVLILIVPHGGCPLWIPTTTNTWYVSKGQERHYSVASTTAVRGSVYRCHVVL